MSQRLVLSFAFIAMESLAIFVVGAVLAGTVNGDGLSFAAFLAAELGGFLLVKAFLRVDLPRRLLIVVGGAVSFVALLTIAGLAIDPGNFPPGWSGALGFVQDPNSAQQGTSAPQVYGIILLVVAWTRGVMLAQQRIERGMALRSFSTGVVVLVLALLFGHDSSARGAVDAASIPTVAAGLLTLTLIHLRDARPADTGLRGPWVSISVGTTALLAVAGGVLGVLPLGPMGFVYDHAISPALSLALFLVAWTLIILAFPFAWLVSEILSHLIRSAPKSQQQQQQTDAGGTNTAVVHNGHPAALIVFFAKAIVVLLVIALVAYIAYRLFRRLHPPPAEDEDRESLRGEGSLSGDLLALLRGLRPRRPVFLGPPPEPQLPAAVLEVRRLYLRLLKLAAERGKERPPAATPEEFRPQSAQVIPAAAAGQLTAAFVTARYGLTELSQVQIAALREELQRAEHEKVP